MQEVAMQKAGGDQAPPLPALNEWTVFSAQHDRDAVVQVEVVRQAVIERELDRKERHIDDQDDDASEIGAGKKGRKEFATPHIDGPRPELSVTIGTYPVGNGDERP